MNDDFSDIGMGPGVKPLSQAGGQLLPEQMDHGVGAVYDRAIRAGASPEQAQDAVDKNVYGHNAVKDRKTGKYIQQGVGAPGHETVGHFNSIRKWEGEVAYQKALKEIFKRDPDRARKLGLPEPARS